MSVLGPNASMHRLPLLATFNWTLTLRLPASSFDHKEDLGKKVHTRVPQGIQCFHLMLCWNLWFDRRFLPVIRSTEEPSTILLSLGMMRRLKYNEETSSKHWGLNGHYDQFSDKVWSKFIYNLWPTFCPLDSGLLPQAVERLWSSSSSVVPRHQHSFDGWIIKSQTELFDFVVSCGQRRRRRYIDMVSSWVQGRRSP